VDTFWRAQASVPHLKRYFTRFMSVPVVIGSSKLFLRTSSASPPMGASLRSLPTPEREKGDDQNAQCLPPCLWKAGEEGIEGQAVFAVASTFARCHRVYFPLILSVCDLVLFIITRLALSEELRASSLSLTACPTPSAFARLALTPLFRLSWLLWSMRMKLCPPSSTSLTNTVVYNTRTHMHVPL